MTASNLPSDDMKRQVRDMVPQKCNRKYIKHNHQSFSQKSCWVPRDENWLSEIWRDSKDSIIEPPILFINMTKSVIRTW